MTYANADDVLCLMRAGWGLYKPGRRGKRIQLTRGRDEPVHHVPTLTFQRLRRMEAIIVDPTSLIDQVGMNYILKPVRLEYTRDPGYHEESGSLDCGGKCG